MVTMSSAVRMHVILVPFPAQGHFNAFLSLAARLHAALPSAAITLVSSPRNVVALRSTSSSSAPFLRFHALPFVPEEHGLPAGAESADAVHVRHFLALFQSTESPSLQAAFDSFLAGVCADAAAAEEQGAPVVVVADPFQAWTTVAARRRGARHAFFDSCGAFGSVVYHSLWHHLPHRQRAPGGEAEEEAEAFCLPDHPEVTVHRSQLPMHLLAADGTDPWSAFHRRQIALGYGTDAVLINTTEELEPAGLRMLRRTLGVPVLPIGPLIRLPTQHASHRDSDSDIIMHWLDAHEKMNQSVLYVSFGSQNSLRPDQMMELASALELTGRPFVWAIRPPVGLGDDDTGTTFGSGKKWLPEGFEERVRANDMGLLVRGWAPQLSILAHASTGAFLSHCGWNSVLESVAHGVPIVGWPLQGDQFFNCEMLAREWGACVEVARGNAEGSSAAVERHRLAEVLETVMGDTAKGAEMRRRVKEIQELIGRAQENGAEALKKMFTSMLRDDTDAGMLLPWSADAGAVLGVSVPHAS